MSAIAGAVDEAQDARAAELMAEQPKFVDATKNFLSMRIAEAMTAPDDAEPADPPLDAAALQAAARALLIAFNAHTPPPSAAWGAAHPQRDDESAAERIDALREQTVHAALCRAARAKGAKPSALLGRSYARRCWAAVAASALAAERGAGDEARAAAAERFLADFARELADDASLAWAADFKEAIRARQLARADDAKARAAAGSSALRGAVADGLAASPEGTVITHMREGEVLHEIEVKPGAGAAGL